MQIARLEARIVQIPLRRKVKHASHERTATDNILVRCTLSDGSIGWGEGVPREYVTGESATESLQLLGDLKFPLKTCPDFVSAVHLAESLPLLANDDRKCKGNAARCALEIAILDAYGRAFGRPLSHVTEIAAPELYEPKSEVSYSGVILSSKLWKVKLFTILQRLYGLRSLKIKVGVAGADDVRRLQAIRRLAGQAMELRIDANEAWSPEETAAKILELEPFTLASVEQPVPHEAVATLAQVREKVATPLMLDESLCSEIDAERAIAGQYCDLFNLRLSKCGGFLPSLRLAECARRHGLGFQLGCQVGETAILSSAGRHFATSVSGIRFLEGSFDRWLVKETLAQEDITFGRGGRAPALEKPGLGITVVESRVDAVTLQRKVILG